MIHSRSARDSTMAAQVARRLFTTDEFHRMAETGILAEDDRLELIEGEIVRMSPIGSRHAACVDRLNALFTARLGKRAIVRVQNPIVINRRSESQPDLTILKARADFYATKHPGPSDALLVVEVVDTSAAYDRTTKLPLYARAGIREVWIVDVMRAVVEVYRQPALQSFRGHMELQAGQRIVPIAFPRTAIRVSDVLGS